MLFLQLQMLPLFIIYFLFWGYSLTISYIDLKLMFFIQMFTDLRCSPSCTRGGIHGTVAICPPDCFQYKGTIDVFYKVIRQVSWMAYT